MKVTTTYQIIIDSEQENLHRSIHTFFNDQHALNHAKSLANQYFAATYVEVRKKIDGKWRPVN